MSTVTISSIIQRDENRVVSTQLDDEIVMMDIENGAYIKLNKMASIIWEQIKEPLPVVYLVENLTKRFRVEEGLCKNETLACLNKMNEQGILSCSRA